MPLRRALSADAEALFDAHQDAVLQQCAAAYSPLQMASWFEGRSPTMYEPALGQGKIWLAEMQGRVMGFVAFETGEVTLLFVRPEAAGAGLGGWLLAWGLQCAGRGHAGPVQVVATLNAVGFYQRRGFVPVAEETLQRGLAQVAVGVIRMEHPAPLDAGRGRG